LRERAAVSLLGLARTVCTPPRARVRALGQFHRAHRGAVSAQCNALARHTLDRALPRTRDHSAAEGSNRGARAIGTLALNSGTARNAITRRGLGASCLIRLARSVVTAHRSPGRASDGAGAQQQVVNTIAVPAPDLTSSARRTRDRAGNMSTPTAAVAGAPHHGFRTRCHRRAAVARCTYAASRALERYVHVHITALPDKQARV